VAALLLLGPARPAPASDPHGPIEVREEWLLAQTRLTLPATSPDTLPAGHTRLRLEGDWGNDFGWRQDQLGESPLERLFLIDGEHRTVALAVVRGIAPRVDVGVRLPLHWRGGGILDGMIDGFHARTAAFGVKDNGRPSFERNQLRVLGRRADMAPIEWTGASGTGLGNLELSARLGLTGSSQPWRTAVLGRLTLPTGTGTFRASGLDLGAQLLAAHRLGGAAHLYLGAGGSYYSDRERQGISYPPFRAYGFLAAEWRFAERWTVLLQTDAASRLVTDVADYPGIQWYLRLALRRSALGPLGVYAGFSENIKHQQATVDFAVFAGVTCELSR
jgi:hypothetical protein